MRPTARKFPLLSTKRLTLRAPTLADAAAFRAILSVPDVTGFSIGRMRRAKLKASGI
jgi:ribosomal-protein-alanine N-acetyltransferase